MTEEKSQVSEMNLCDKCNDILEPNETNLCEICREFAASNPSPTSGGGLTVQANEEIELALDVLRSAYSIADRKGRETNWPAFKERASLAIRGLIDYRNKLSHSDSPKGLGVQPDIKESIKDAADFIDERLELEGCSCEADPTYGPETCSNCQIRAAIRSIYRNLVRLTLTDEDVSGKILKPQSEIESTPGWAFRDTTDYRDELEKDLRQANVRVAALEKERAAFKETSDLWWQCYQDRCEGALTEVTHLKRAEKERDELKAKLHVATLDNEDRMNWLQALTEQISTLKAEVTRLTTGIQWIGNMFVEGDPVHEKCRELLAPKKEGV